MKIKEFLEDFFLIFVFCFLFFLTGLSFQKKKEYLFHDIDTRDYLIVGIDSNFPPFCFRDKSFKLKGIEICLINKIGIDLQKKIVFKEVAYSEMIKAVQCGNVDCVVSGITITKNRAKKISFIPYHQLAKIDFNRLDGNNCYTCMVYVDEDVGGKISSFNDIVQSDFSVGVLEKTIPKKIFLEECGTGFSNYKTIDSINDALLFLQHKKIDFFITQNVMAQAIKKRITWIKIKPLFMKQIVFEKIFRKEGSVHEIYVGIGVHKENKKLIEMINASMKDYVMQDSFCMENEN